MSAFRSVEFWKSAVMNMPDNSFYELLRSVFGKIKTPFNKQQLLKDLEIFLLQKDIQKTIAAYINENDAKIITAVSIFDEPSPEDLERFFKDEFGNIQLHENIVNLEERFILYRYKNGLELNPVLKPILAPITEDTSALFPVLSSKNTAKKIKSTVTLNDRILAGLLSFVFSWQEIYRREGVLRKQTADAGKICFPGLDLQQTLGALQILGLFYRNGDKLLPNIKNFTDIALLPVRKRMLYCAAALLIYKEENHFQNKWQEINNLAPYYKTKVRQTAGFIHNFLETKNEMLLEEKTLVKLALIAKSRTKTDINIDHLIDAVKKVDLFDCEPPVERGSITIDSGFSILVYPEINFADAVELAIFSNIKEAGAVVQFELEKASVIRAFDNGISAQNIIDTINRLSAKKMPDTLIWNVKDWEKRHSEVSLKSGTVLTLSKDKHYLAQTMPLSAMINETLAPGVYLLNESVEEEAVAALNNAGIDIIARNKNRTAASHQNTTTQNYFPDFPPSNSFSPKTQGIRTASKKEDCTVLINNFNTILEKMPVTKTERDELSARIDRRLILCEAQLKEANIRYEKLEARHMDYAGKQNIAKQAISQSSPVEVKWPGAGKEKCIYGMPIALDKEESGLVLVVDSAEKNEKIRIPLAKISLLRRIKKSIFES